MSIASEITRLQEAKADIKEAIENKGVAVSSSLTISDYAPLIDSIPTGTTEVESKDVDFYDYDGTRLYSYTKQEFLALTEMPANPTHEGLTSQGWNWSLVDAKTYVSEMGGLDIGQYFVTDDNKTRLYLTIDNLKTFYLGIGLNGTATIEWGDGTSDTISGTSTGTTIYTQHAYSNSGDYVIKISSSGTYRLGNGNNYSNVLSSLQTNSAKNIIYLNMINKIELASNCEMGRQAFTYMGNLKTITISNTTKNVDSASYNYTNLQFAMCPNYAGGGSLFSAMYNLKVISIPLLVGNFASALGFANSTKIKRIWVPSSVTNLNQMVFQGANGVSKVKLPNSITTISNRAFMDAYGLKVADFRNFDHIPTLTVDNLFRNNQDDFQIVVPDSLYDSWIVATNWSNYASYIVKESEYVG